MLFILYLSAELTLSLVSEDLDADLYADLYGDEYTAAVAEAKQEKLDKTVSDSKPAPATIPAATTAPVKDQKAPTSSTQTTDPRQNKPAPVPVAAVPTPPLQTQPIATVISSDNTPAPIQTYTQPLHNSQPIAVAPLSSTTTQSIPSYGSNRAYGGGAPIPTGQQYEHRGVRPSEMKEEG